PRGLSKRYLVPFCLVYCVASQQQRQFRNSAIRHLMPSVGRQTLSYLRANLFQLCLFMQCTDGHCKPSSTNAAAQQSQAPVTRQQRQGKRKRARSLPGTWTWSPKLCAHSLVWAQIRAG